MFVGMVSLTTERDVTVVLILTRSLVVAVTTNVAMELPVSSLETPPAGYHDYLSHTQIFFKSKYFG